MNFAKDHSDIEPRPEADAKTTETQVDDQNEVTQYNQDEKHKAGVSTCDVSMISSNHIDDDVTTLATSDSLESVAMSTVTIATTGITTNDRQQQQLSPRIRAARPWTATGGSSGVATRSCTHQHQQLTGAESESKLNGTSSGPKVNNKDKISTLTLVESLNNEVEQLRAELAANKLAICRMNEREKQMRDRLSEQAQRQLEKGTTKFEDISLGDNRPTQLIKRYGNLYSESRLEAMDALDELDDMVDCEDLKTKLLLSVVVLAFRSAERSLEELKCRVGELLYIPTTLESSATQHRQAARELEETIAVYLRKTVEKHDITSNYEEVCERVWSTLFDYPALRHCSGLLRYIKDCVRLAWALAVQNPPLVIDYESKAFDPDLHTRFHTSDPDSDVIKTVLWPMLTEGEAGNCVYKGVVVT